ncbi:MAG: class I SAM-dependent methyltransferase [candidate division KSB1 bacterium]|nr:class I SAM-dependent methyltransferase [candidate division KSB1 bacterium]
MIRQKQIQRFYQEQASLVSSPFITQYNQVKTDLLRKVFHQLNIPYEKSGIILDVGCGRGLLSTIFENGTYIGLDLVIQKTVLKIKKENACFVQGDGHFLPLRSGSVNFILCLDSFEHYPDMLKAAKEFRRVLQDGGSLFLSIPNYSNTAGLLKRYFEESGQSEPNGWAPFDFWKRQELEQFITPKRIKEIFYAAGFRRCEFVGYSEEFLMGIFPWIWHPRMPMRLANAICRMFSPLRDLFTGLFPSLSLHTFWKMEL